MLRYREIEHTADVGVEIYGKTMEELFQNAGYALFNTIVDASTIQPVVTRTLSVTGPDIETLLINWLRELLYQFSVEQEVYNEFGVQNVFYKEQQDASCAPTKLEVTISGEKLDLERHKFNTEIKAVTYHQFAVAHEDGRWQARVIFDV